MHPAEFIREGRSEELKENVKEGVRIVAESFKGKPVWYRSVDARTEEFKNLKGGEKEPLEDNPMLGWHGIRRSLDEPGILRAEFKALKELVDEGFEGLGFMLPFVQSAEEVSMAKEIAASEGLQGSVKFGLMIEVPAAVWIIDELVREGIDFVSFGTNDLTQLMLGVDRNNERLNKLFNELHPAVLRSMSYCIYKCRKQGVETSICGQAGSNPDMVRKLVRMGITSVSANIDAVSEIMQVVADEEKRIIISALKEMKGGTQEP